MIECVLDSLSLRRSHRAYHERTERQPHKPPIGISVMIWKYFQQLTKPWLKCGVVFIMAYNSQFFFVLGEEGRGGQVNADIC